jgi:hypothetical protein
MPVTVITDPDLQPELQEFDEEPNYRRRCRCIQGSNPYGYEPIISYPNVTCDDTAKFPTELCLGCVSNAEQQLNDQFPHPTFLRFSKDSVLRRCLFVIEREVNQELGQKPLTVSPPSTLTEVEEPFSQEKHQQVPQTPSCSHPIFQIQITDKREVQVHIHYPQQEKEFLQTKSYTLFNYVQPCNIPYFTLDPKPWKIRKGIHSTQPHSH